MLQDASYIYEKAEIKDTMCKNTRSLSETICSY